MSVIPDFDSNSCYISSFTTDKGLLSDIDIINCKGMIEPFTDHIVREIDGKKVLSYGLSSYGYDVRLSGEEFYIYRSSEFEYLDSIIDPKDFDKNKCLKKLNLCTDNKNNKFFVMPPKSYGLAVIEECLNMPSDISAIAYGKSSYTRTAVNTHITPIEAGWKGHLTVATSNLSDYSVRIYANEGFAQILFFRGIPCQTSYEDRKGKYQNQGKCVTTIKM